MWLKGSLLSLGIGLVIIGLNLSSPPEPTAAVAETLNAEEDIDFSMQGIHSQHRGLTGQVKYELLAETLDHYAVSASSQLYQPAMTIYDDMAIPWFISAKYGQVADSQEEAKLWGNVVIRRTHNDDATATMIMYTDELTVYPKQELATTDRPVRILRPGHTTDAIGMRALFGQGQVTLKNKVRGYHEAVGQSS